MTWKRLQVQWAKEQPDGFDEVEFDGFSKLENKGDPEKGLGKGSFNNKKGWIQSVSFMGNRFKNYDHYAVVPLPGDGYSRPFVKLVGWWDDPEDHTPDRYFAKELYLYRVQPDIKFSGALNSKGYNIHYAAPVPMAWWRKNCPRVENTVLKPWEDFTPPPEEFVRHGKWIPDDLYSEMDRFRPDSWRHWGPDGYVPQQRPLGKYSKPVGTRTYYQRDTARATTVHVGTDELAFETTAGAGETLSELTASGTDELSFIFTTPSGEPDNATWPDGTYQCQFDASTVDTTLTFGLLTIGGSAGHFGRVPTSLSGADTDTKTQAEGAFATPAGLKLATVDTTGSSWAGLLASNRFECLVAQASGAKHGNETLTLTFDADAFADGPWASPAITGNGDLASAVSTLAGEGTSSSSGNGSLDSVVSTLAAEGVSSSTGNGSLDSVDSTLAGEGTVADTPLAGNGDLASADSTLSASGVSSSAGDGDLASADATVSGEGTVSSIGNGSLASAVSTLAGEGTVADPAILGSGDLVSVASAVSGEGVSSSTGNGDLAPAVSTASGEGVSSSAGNGDLAAADSTLAGSGGLDLGVIAFGNGDLAAVASSVAGEGVTSSVGNGNLAANDSTLSASGIGGPTVVELARPFVYRGRTRLKARKRVA